MNYYYYVWVRSNRYRGDEPLTYTSDQKLRTGSIVEVELQTKKVIGFISGPAPAPRFKTKQIVSAYALPPLPAYLIQLAQWLQQYYPSPIGIVSQQLLPAALSQKNISEVDIHENTHSIDDSRLPELNHEQAAAVTEMTEPTTYILHGVTGSGKTRVYIELALKTFEAGRSAFILTPEISLTSQLAAHFRSVFEDRVLVIHSQLTPKERQLVWLECLLSESPRIIIGPRSALFSPLPRPGLIVLDEAHEVSYKQEQAPQYQTSRVAAVLSRLTKSTLILGSATPAISDYFLAQQKGNPIVHLKSIAQAQNTAKPTINVVDIKQRDLFTRSNLLSKPLIESIDRAISHHEQTLLYLNRRGTARLVMCEVCGWQAQCPHCDIPLTYHGDTHSLRCHSCNYHIPTPTACPVCNHPSILYKTAGTKAVVAEVEKLFPQASVARFDTDNLKAERFEQQYEQILAGNVDILVGTQLLAKGIDLPKLSTLGVVLADTSLYVPDYTSSERTFQLINQVYGRIGRGHVLGHAVIQTFHPESDVIHAALQQDYEGFYEGELRVREAFHFPPFCHLLKVTCRRSSAKSAQTACDRLINIIRSAAIRVTVEGPAPAFHEISDGKFHWQLVIKAADRQSLIAVMHLLPQGWSADIDPANLL